MNYQNKSGIRFLLCTLFGVMYINLQAQETTNKISIDKDILSFTLKTAGTPCDSSFHPTFGCSVVDYDNDGLDDIIEMNPSQQDILYHNEGHGVFKKVEGNAIGKDVYPSSGPTWGDYDNDGKPDLFITTMGTQNVLFHNEGNGNFTRIEQGNLVDHPTNSFHSSWVDYDNDGWLDLFVSNLSVFTKGPGSANFLYHNNGDGIFTQVTSGDIVTDTKNSFCGNFADINNDGYPDLVTVDLGYKNSMYKNKGDGTFFKMNLPEFENDTAYSIGASWGDYNNDGYLDLFIANGGFRNEKNYLFKNNGNETFTKITEGDIVNKELDTWNGLWGDLDNDGDLDLVEIPYQMDKYIYLNNGDGTFTTKQLTFDKPLAACGSLVDIDNDGDLDIFIPNGGGKGKNLLYINNGNANHWIEIKCKGTVSNISAIGARIKIKSTIHGKPTWQIREISGNQGMRSQGSLKIHVGLGDASIVDSIIVEWPSHQRTIQSNVKSNQILTIVEPVTKGFIRTGFSADNLSGIKSLSVKFFENSFTDPKMPIISWAWDFDGDGKIDSNEKNPSFTYQVTDDRKFTVSLTVSNGIQSKKVTKQNYIQVLKSSNDNIAMGKKASVSSVENPSNGAGCLTDGSMSTRWSSEFTDHQWALVDLGSIQKFGAIIINWEAAFAKEYKVELSSDSIQWNTVYENSDAKGGRDEIALNRVTARYIRITSNKRATQYGYSIYEIEVFDRIIP